mgnify:FL=1
MSNEGFQKLVLEKLSGLEEGQKDLTEKVVKLEEGQKDLTGKVVKLEEGQKDLTKQIGELKEGQNEIKNFMVEVEAKNANRHIEMMKEINGLREDLNTVELVTSKNWNDIAKLKSVK